jgi:hypothetical protein
MNVPVFSDNNSMIEDISNAGYMTKVTGVQDRVTQQSPMNNRNIPSSDFVSWNDLDKLYPTMEEKVEETPNDRN